MRIAALRHLPTDSNREGLLQGSRDCKIAPLDDLMVARIAARKLEISALGPFDRVLVSDLCRTRQTAQLYGFERPVVEPLLRELNFGSFEGKLRSELEAHFGVSWKENPRRLGLGLGESMLDFETRIKLALEKHREAQRLLLFGHGAWIRGLMSIVRHGDIRNMNQLKLENNELVVIDIEE